MNRNRLLLGAFLGALLLTAGLLLPGPSEPIDRPGEDSSPPPSQQVSGAKGLPVSSGSWIETNQESEAVRSAPARSGTIAGRVQRPHGEKVSGASVRILPDGPSTRTDIGGKFSLDDLPPGLHALRIRSTSGSALLLPDVATGTENLQVFLPSGPTIRLYLLRPDGSLETRASIVADDGPWSARGLPGQDGGWILHDIPGPTVRLRIRGPFVPFERVVAVQKEIRLRIQPGLRYAGRVLNAADHDGIAGARVRIHNQQRGSETARETLTDPTGQFEIIGLEPGPIGVRVEASGHPLFVGQALLGVEAVDNIEILLPTGFRLRGRTLDPNGHPLGGVEISKRRAVPTSPRSTGSDTLLARTVSDPRGRFDLILGDRPSIEAPLDLLLIHPEHPPTLLRVDPLREGSIDLQLARGIRLVGTAHTTNHHPIAGVRIQGACFDPSAPLPTSNPFEVLTNQKGRFTTPPLAGSQIQLLVACPGYRSMTRTIELLPRRASGEFRVDLVLEPERRLAGRVVDGAGRPIPGATVVAEWVDPGGGDPPTSTDWTDTEGRFDLGGLGEAPVQLRAQAPGHLESPPVDADPGTSEITLRLPRRGLVRGRVVGPEGPLQKVRLRFFDRESEGTPECDLDLDVLDQDGRFLVTDLDPDRTYALVVLAGGHRPARFDPVRPTRDRGQLLEVVLDPALRFTARVVTGVEERSVPGALVVRRTHADRTLPGDDQNPILAESGPDGIFVVEGVEPGEELRVIHPHHRPAIVTVTPRGLLRPPAHRAGGGSHHHPGQATRPDPNQVRVTVRLTPRPPDPDLTDPDGSDGSETGN